MYSYRKYDNYDALEVPYTEAIPSDHDGVLGVPISSQINIILNNLKLFEQQKIMVKVYHVAYGEEYHNKSYDQKEVSEEVNRLYIGLKKIVEVFLSMLLIIVQIQN